MLLLPGVLVSAEMSTGTLKWVKGKLEPTSRLGAGARAVVQQVNRHQFSEALKAIGTLADASPRLRGELALAVGGHLSNDNPQPALKVARTELDRAIQANGDDLLARRLRNHLEVFGGLDSIVLPWAPNLAGHSWVPAPQLLPARDMIRGGELDQGRNRIGQLKGVAPRTYLLSYWQLAAFFEGQSGFGKAFDTLAADLQAALDDVSQRGDADDKRAAGVLSGLLGQARKHPWATMTVPPDSLLHPRAMLEPMRAYYWWWKQMGAAQRPMSKQGFDEIIAGQKRRFPDSPIVKIYTGRRVAWDPDLPKVLVAKGTPSWAVHQRELRARVDHVVRWWFEVRQEPDGQLGGGWEDDVESLRRFSQSALLTGDPAVIAGIHRLADGVWNRGVMVNGFDRELKDVEHSSEMAADTSVLVALDYGLPVPVERCMRTCKTIDELHFGTNTSGRRQFRSMVLSGTEVSAADNQAYDVLYSGRAMRPVAMLAWYNRHPRAVKLLVDWARTWSEAALRAADGKPAGVFPAAIHFGDERLNGTGSWWNPGLGDLYRWNPQDLDMVWGKILLAYRLTGDESLLRGVHAQLEIVRKYVGKTIENPAAGSLDWVGMQLKSHFWLARWYRAYTGRDDYDDLIRAGGGYGRYQLTGKLSELGSVHTGELAAMRFNLPMLTTEVRGTDRINLFPFSLMGPMGGGAVAITQAPAVGVTWRQVSADFAALVGHHDSRSLVALVHTFADNAKPLAQFWALQPGRYRLERREDANHDGTVEAQVVETIDFDHVERLADVSFKLPRATLCQVHIRQLRAFDPLPATQPDLAIGPGDLRITRMPGDNQPGMISVTLHNIGTAVATDVELEVLVQPSSGGAPKQQFLKKLGAIQSPADLLSRQKTVTLPWKPMSSGNTTLVARVRCRSGEITSANNRVSISVPDTGSSN